MTMTAERMKDFGFSATLKSKEIVNKLKAEGYEVLAFTVGEPDFDTPEYIRKEAINAINSGFTHYTPSSGIPELRSAVSDKSNTENQIPLIVMVLWNMSSSAAME